MTQWLNLDAFVYFPYVRLLNRRLAVPHFSVKDINYIDPQKLRDYGFKGLVFDKDNTLTAPYVNQIYPTIKNAFSRFQRLFGDRMVIMSNSAGTGDDSGYRDALKIERDLGVPVLRHGRKKPGGISAVCDYFQCDPVELVMFGDRLFTDIVFGNRYGMLTIHTAFLTEEGDLKAAARVRRHEVVLLERWRTQGLMPPSHSLYHADICLESLLTHL